MRMYKYSTKPEVLENKQNISLAFDSNSKLVKINNEISGSINDNYEIKKFKKEKFNEINFDYPNWSPTSFEVDKNENKSSDNPEQQNIASNSNSDLSPEDRSKQQKLEQWLRKIPDDPGRLLRNKMKREFQRRDKKQIESKHYW